MSSAGGKQIPGEQELVAPNPAGAAPDPFVALLQFVGGAEALGRDLAATLRSLLHTPWAAAPVVALVAAEVCRRRVLKGNRCLHPPISLPGITGPSGLA
jgi:hypothetical protein